MTDETGKPLIFLSYSHRDEAEKQQLVDHLSVLRHSDIELWTDDHIAAGEDWERALMDQIGRAHIAVLLISEHFLNSEFILERELPALYQRVEAGEMTLFPIVARPCAWSKVPWLARMNLWPKKGEPVWGGDASVTLRHLAALAEEVAIVVERNLSRPPGTIRKAGSGRQEPEKTEAGGHSPEPTTWYQVSFLEEELLRILEELEDGLEEERKRAVFGVETSRRWRKGVAAVRKRLKKNFSVVVVGHFKRGKSTLVNALLGTEVATSDIAPETVTINEICYGPRLRAEACLRDGGRISLMPEQIRRRELEAVLATVPEPVDHLEIQVPVPWLEGICLVDTPGTGDLFQRFDRQVHDYLSQADAILYLLSPLSPVAESERDFLQLAVLPQDFAKVTFVVNMVDKVASERDTSRVLNLIRQRISRLFPEANLFGVSALDEIARQRGQERPLPDRTQSLGASFDALRAHLQESILENRQLIQLERAMSDAGVLMQEIEGTVDHLQASLHSDPGQLATALGSYDDTGSPLHRKAAGRLEEMEQKVIAMGEEACGWLDAFSDRLEKTFDSLGEFRVEELQRHFPFFLTDALRSALNLCIDTHRPVILAELRQARQELALEVDGLLEQPDSVRPLKDAVSKATFGQEMWEELDMTSFLAQCTGSELFAFGAEILVRFNKGAKEQKKVGLFQQRLRRALPEIRKALQEEARKLYATMAGKLVAEEQELQKQTLDASRLALQRARELVAEEEEELSAPEILGAVRDLLGRLQQQLSDLQRRLGWGEESLFSGVETPEEPSPAAAGGSP